MKNGTWIAVASVADAESPSLKDLLPWVAQWHPEPDPRTNQPFAEFLECMIETQARELGVSLDAIEVERLGG